MRPVMPSAQHAQSEASSLAELAKKIDAGAQAAVKKQRDATQQIAYVGGLLLRVKTKIDHGNFGAWLRQNFRYSLRTAQIWMATAEAMKGKNSEMMSPSDIELVDDHAKSAAAAHLNANSGQSPQQVTSNAPAEQASGVPIEPPDDAGDSWEPPSQPVETRPPPEKGKRAPAPRGQINGQVVFDWTEWHSAMRSFARSLDHFAKVKGQVNEAGQVVGDVHYQGIMRKFTEIIRETDEWYRKLTGQKPPKH